MRLGALPRPVSLSAALGAVSAAVVTAPASASPAPTPNAAVRSTAKAAAVAPSPAVFSHPGVNLNTAQLDFVRTKAQAGRCG